MIIGIIFKDKFYDHSYFFIQFSSDTKIYNKMSLNIVGTP